MVEKNEMQICYDSMMIRQLQSMDSESSMSVEKMKCNHFGSKMPCTVLKVHVKIALVNNNMYYSTVC